MGLRSSDKWKSFIVTGTNSSCDEITEVQEEGHNQDQKIGWEANTNHFLPIPQMDCGNKIITIFSRVNAWPNHYNTKFEIPGWKLAMRCWGDWRGSWTPRSLSICRVHSFTHHQSPSHVPTPSTLSLNQKLLPFQSTTKSTKDLLHTNPHQPQ